MIREVQINDRKDIDEMQFQLQEFFSEIDQTGESLPYKDIGDAHLYMQKMFDDVKNMSGKFFVAEDGGKVIGLLRYNSFKDLFEDFGISILADVSMTKDELLGALSEFYTPEKQAEYGIVGIRLKML